LQPLFKYTTVISQNESVGKLYTIGGSAYAGNAKIPAALRVDAARLEERLAFPGAARGAARGPGAARAPRAPRAGATTFPFAVGSGGSECDEGHSKENGGFEELHGCGSEDVGVK
jgi:hypothetical protein